MNERTLRALIEAGAIKRIHIIAEGSYFQVKADTATGSVAASTVNGKIKTWRTLDSVAKWIRALGIGNASLDVAKWQPRQKGMRL